MADRAGVVLERQQLDEQLTVVTVNQTNPQKKFAGMSFLIDAARGVVVQWNWAGSARYSSLGEVKAMQDSVLRVLAPCLSRNHAGTGHAQQNAKN